MYNIAKNMPRGIVNAAVEFDRFGVRFAVNQRYGEPTTMCPLYNASFSESGEVECPNEYYVFADLDTVLRVNQDEGTIKRVKSLPPALYRVREEALERLHHFFTHQKVHVDTTATFPLHTYEVSVMEGNNVVYHDRIDEPHRYFKDDGTFKSNGALVRFFCAYLL